MCIPIIFIDESVTNSDEAVCYSTCDLSNPAGSVQDADMMDTSFDDFNSCCNSASTTSGYDIIFRVEARSTPSCTALCKFCCNYISVLILI